MRILGTKLKGAKFAKPALEYLAVGCQPDQAEIRRQDLKFIM